MQFILLKTRFKISAQSYIKKKKKKIVKKIYVSTSMKIYFDLILSIVFIIVKKILIYKIYLPISSVLLNIIYK
jgi:hypothetical protein